MMGCSMDPRFRGDAVKKENSVPAKARAHGMCHE